MPSLRCPRKVRGRGKGNEILESQVIKPRLQILGPQRSCSQGQGKDALLFQEREAARGEDAREQLETKAEGDGAEEEETFSMGLPVWLMQRNNQPKHPHTKRSGRCHRRTRREQNPLAF